MSFIDIILLILVITGTVTTLFFAVRKESHITAKNAEEEESKKTHLETEEISSETEIQNYDEITSRARSKKISKWPIFFLILYAIYLIYAADTSSLFDQRRGWRSWEEFYSLAYIGAVYLSGAFLVWWMGLIGLENPRQKFSDHQKCFAILGIIGFGLLIFTVYQDLNPDRYRDISKIGFLGVVASYLIATYLWLGWAQKTPSKTEKDEQPRKNHAKKA